MLRLQTLGELRLEAGPSARLSSRRKELTLLSYLARRPSKPVGRGELAELLWGERDSARARQSLRQALLELKRAIGDGLETETDTVHLEAGAVHLDAAEFNEDLAAGRWDVAVGRWHGDFLAGAEDMGGEEFRIWLEAEREGLRRGLRFALVRLIEEARRAGAWERGIKWAERWVEVLPQDEDGHRHLVELLHLDGRTAQALARYAAFASQLRATDSTPTPAFVQLGRMLERHAGETRNAATPGSAALFTPDLVGRGPALAELLAAWERVRSGNGEAIVVEGEAGIGKTRLCEEFLRWLERHAGHSIGSRAYSRGNPTLVPLGVLGQLVSALATASGLAGAPSSALAVLGSIAPAVKARFPILPESHPDVPATGDAFRDALAAVAEEEPTLLFVDDLPQADPASRQVLMTLLEHPVPGVLVIATARSDDEENPLSFSSLPISRLKLAPLSIPEVELLVSSILELGPDDRRHLAARLHGHGGGSPFYIIELVSALADDGTLAPTEHGAWRLTARDSRLPLPSGLRDLVTRRLARLSSSARTALEAAAVLELPFDRKLLADVAGLSQVAVDGAIEELLLQRFIREAGPGRYEFAHELVRSHVERSVPATTGEELSYRAVRALESSAETNSAAQAALVQHRVRASALTTARRRRGHRRLLAATAGATLVAAALVVGLRAGSGPPTSPTALAVLPFSVSGSPELGYLREGMVTLLSTELDGVGTLRIADPRAVLGISTQVGRGAPDAAQGMRVAARLGTGTFVIGDIVEGGGRIRLGATAYRMDKPSQPVARAEVEGTMGELFELVGALAGRLLTGLSAGPYEQLTRVAATTTRSLPALKAYLEGERLFRNGAFHPAARAFQRAVSEDSTFALAHYWLSVASWWADDSKVIDSAAARAVQLSGRLSERDRRLFEGWDAFLKGDAPGAERVYRQIVALEPENVEAWLQLGEVLFHSGPRRGYSLASARLPFNRVLFYEPEHTSAVLHLARIAASERRLAELDTLVIRVLQLSPAGEWALEAKALRSFGKGDATEQELVLAELRTALEGRVWNTARYVAVGTQDLNGAKRIVGLLTEPTRPSEVRAFGYVARAHLELAHGRIEAADTVLRPAFLLDPVSALEQRALIALLPFFPRAQDQLLALRDSVIRGVPLAPAAYLETSHLANLHDGVHQELQEYLAAGLSLRIDDTITARSYLRRLERPRSNPLAASIASDAAGSIRAQLAIRAGRRVEATRELEEVQRLEARVGLIGGSPFYSQGLERYLYAGLLENQGRLEDALRWYNSFSNNSIFDFVYLAPSHFRRGRILEGLGREKEAAEHYRRGLELYQRSDPELRSEVRAAEEGLARLTGGMAAASR